jgi:enoyl-CoA hydratase
MPAAVDIRGAVALITIDNPGKMNAMSVELLAELNGALDRVEADADVRAVVLTGAGEKAFIAGADISHMVEATPDAAQAYARMGHDLCNRLEGFPKPVIAAINGYALGGGCEIALACDIRLAADTAKLGQPEVNLGIIPGWGGTQRLPRLTNPGYAKELIFSGRHVGADEALAFGLVNHVVPLAELVDAAVSLGDQIASRSPRAVAIAKGLVNDAVDSTYAATLDHELTAFAECFGSADQREGMTAFFEKREPRFTGA